MEILAIDLTTCRYKGQDAEVLRDLSVRLRAGEVLAVTGAAESGKTTLCRVAGGFLQGFFGGTVQGSVRLGGLDISTLTQAELIGQVGMVFQNPLNQFTGMRFTVEEEIAVGPENLGLTRSETGRRIDETLALLELEHLRAHNPFTLSPGQMQRVALAAMLAMHPQLLILDEPTTLLDPHAEAQVHTLLRRLADTGLAILMTSSHLDGLATLADSLLVLQQGSGVLSGTVRNVGTHSSLAEYGVNPPFCVQLAQQARSRGLWTESNLPLTVDELTAVWERLIPCT